MSRYIQESVVTTLLHRAGKISSDNPLFLCEVHRTKQLFVNDNYPMSVINDCVKSYFDKFRNNNNSTENIKNNSKSSTKIR